MTAVVGGLEVCCSALTGVIQFTLVAELSHFAISSGERGRVQSTEFSLVVVTP